MTRKDFVMIADVIRFLPLPLATRDIVALEFAEELATTNPRFDKERFVKACTLPQKGD